jgi:sulfide dehydrogenase cytochrome subunit
VGPLTLEVTAMRLTPILFALIIPLPAAAAGATGTAAGAMLGDTCAACHGTRGRVFDEAMPPLAGMAPERFVSAMLAFKRGERPAVIMDRVARGYDETEIRAMAEFFAAQPAAPWR